MWVNLPQRTDWHLFHTLAPWHPKSLLLTAAILHTWWTQLCCYFLSKPGYKMLQESLTESETDQDRIEHLKKWSIVHLLKRPTLNSAWNQSAQKHQSSGVLFRNVKPHEAAEANHPWSQLHIFPHQNMTPPTKWGLIRQKSANIEQRYLRILRYLWFLVNFTPFGSSFGEILSPTTVWLVVWQRSSSQRWQPSLVDDRRWNHQAIVKRARIQWI